MTQCGFLCDYEHFGGICCLHLQVKRWREQVPLKYLVTTHETTWCHHLEDHNFKNICN
jgi:hypothetical protein